MTSVLLGDIINSRKAADPSEWLQPLKKLLARYGKNPGGWIIERGDTFQLEITDPSLALQAALRIKALIKSLDVKELDVRIAIGVGKKSFQGERISESNGEAFIHSGETFESLKKIKQNLAIKTPWKALDEELNLLLKFASITMDKWTVSSAEIMYHLLMANKPLTQKDLTKKLNLNQSSISERMTRARSEEILELEQFYRTRIQQKLSL